MDQDCPERGDRKVDCIHNLQLRAALHKPSPKLGLRPFIGHAVRGQGVGGVASQEISAGVFSFTTSLINRTKRTLRFLWPNERKFRQPDGESCPG
jgi:hypothetical protein